MPRGLQHTTGFTLLELMVVLVIAALMAALAIPNWSTSWQEIQMRRTVREVAADLREARGLALNARQEAVVRFDLDTRRVVRGDGRRYRSLPADLKIDVVAAESERSGKASAAIRFYPDGSASGGRIRFSTAKSQLSVDVNWLTGRVFILDDERI